MLILIWVLFVNARGSRHFDQIFKLFRKLVAVIPVLYLNPSLDGYLILLFTAYKPSLPKSIIHLKAII